MTTADLVNLILNKLRTGRVEFLDISSLEHNRKELFSVVEMFYGGNIFDVRCREESIAVSVRQIQRDQGPLTVTHYSQWLEGVLNGKTRNDAGELS